MHDILLSSVNMHDILLSSVNIHNILLFSVDMHDILLSNINMHDMKSYCPVLIYMISLSSVNMHDISLSTVNLHDIFVQIIPSHYDTRSRTAQRQTDGNDCGSLFVSTLSSTIMILPLLSIFSS